MVIQSRQKGFSTFIILVVAAVIAVVAGAGVWYSMKSSSTMAPTPSETSMTPSGSMGASSMTPSTAPGISAGASASVSLSPGNSDASLDKDSQDVSTKLNAVNNDSVSIDQGINDQQGSLSEQ